MSIQQALDAGGSNRRVVVCPGIYSEALRIPAGTNLTLEGRSAILDGTLVAASNRHAVTIGDGVDRFTLRGFEIRNYRDSSSGFDTSFAIRSIGRSTAVTIRDNHVHDNGRIGITVRADASRWTIENNRFAGHSFAHVLASDATRLTLAANSFDGAPRAAIVAYGTQRLDVVDNTIQGGGGAGIVLGPAYGHGGVTTQAIVAENTVSGRWSHGIWAAGVPGAILRDNVVTLSSSASGLTVGGNPEDVAIYGNLAPTAGETKTIKGVLEAFRTGAVPSNPMLIQSIADACVGWDCWFDRVFGGFLQPETSNPATAQAGCLAPDTCPDAEAVLLFALNRGLNPVASGTYSRYVTALAACQGQSDACLSTQLIDPTDPLPAYAWTVPVNDPLIGTGNLKFLDIAIQRPEETRAHRSVTAELDQNWTTFVACRYYPTGASTPQPCLAAPRIFDYGLDLSFAPTSFARHVSEWRLRLPTDLVHDSFDRLHSADATLFIQTTRPHDDASPPPPTAGAAPLTPFDPLRQDTAGRAFLACSISPSSLGLPPTGPADDCGSPVLLTEQASTVPAWCTGQLPTHDEVAHESLVSEVVAGWAWSRTCTPIVGRVETPWNEAFTTDDLARYSAAQEMYYNSTSGGRATAAANARGVLDDVILRHLGLLVPKQGMPLQLDETALVQTTPMIAEAALPTARKHAAAVWTGSEAYVFGGTGAAGNPSNQVIRYDPTTGTVAQAGTLAVATWGASAIWTGEVAIIFGGRTATNPLSTIQVYDPLTRTTTRYPTVLPVGVAYSSAVWDPRPRPAAGCPTGCAYVFGGGGESSGQPPVSSIYRFSPVTGVHTMAATLPTGRLGTAAAWTGSEAVIVGGYRWALNGPTTDYDTILRYDPDTDTLRVSAATLPAPQRFLSAVSDASSVYVLNACAQPCTSRQVVRYDLATDIASVMDVPMAQPVRAAPAVWTAEGILVFGGEGCGGECATIQTYLPSTSATLILSDLYPTASNFSVVDLEHDAGTASNARVVSYHVWDALAGWVPIENPGLVAFTPVTATTEITFVDLAGVLQSHSVQILLTTDKLPTPLPPLLVEYGGVTYGNVVTWNPNNRDYLHDFDPLTSRVHAVNLVNLTTPAGPAYGLFDVGFQSPAAVTDVGSCVRELYTANASGVQTNYVGMSRLAAGTLANATCVLHSLVPTLPLSLDLSLLLTLEIRQADVATAVAVSRTAYEPLMHALDKDTPRAYPTIEQSAATYAPTPLDAAIQTRHVRVVLTLPASLSSSDVATVLTGLVQGFAGRVAIFSVEIENVPLTTQLSKQIEEAVREHGSVILAPAGTLPEVAASWAPQEKLMTITGLAAHPLVITIGTGSRLGRVSPASRLGPTAWLTPKPDFVAPGPNGIGSVVNALPLVEATMIRGVRHTDLVRATLGTFAVPILGENGTPATYWEQGLGVLDLSLFVNLTGIVTLDDLAARVAPLVGKTADQVLTESATDLKLDPASAGPRPARDFLGATLPVDALLRTAFGAVTTNVTISSAALPSSLQLDFGVVNHRKQGSASLQPVPLDPIVAKTAQSYRLLLQEAGYTGTQLDTIVNGLTDTINVTAAASHDVRITTTHYLFEDTFSKDLLFTLYGAMLGQVLNDTASVPLGGTPADLAAVRSVLQPWVLTPYSLANPVDESVRMNVLALTDCNPVAAEGLAAATDVMLRVLRRTSGLLAQAHGGGASDIPATSGEWLAKRNPNYAMSQAGQLLCLQDVLDLLAYVSDRADELRVLKSTPWGAYDATEAWVGSWNVTVLGTEIRDAALALGIDPADLATSSSVLVIDQLVDFVQRVSSLLAQKISLLRVPRIVPQAPTGVVDVTTSVAATQASPFGLYVGLALMTTRNVTLRNPLTGELVMKRDVTVPVPSFLFNTPTLEVNVTFRDGSPLVDTSLQFHDHSPQIFDRARVVVNHTRIEAGIRFELSPNRDLERASESQSLLRLLQNITALGTKLGSDDANNDGPLGRGVARALLDLQAVAEARLALTTGNVAFDANETARRLEGVMVALTSRLDYQGNLTNAAGQTRIENAMPGSFALFLPYPYPMTASRDMDYPTRSPGGGAFAASMNPPDMQLHRLVRDSLQGFGRHPTANDPSLDASAYASGAACPAALPACDTYPWFEVLERKVGPVHQFGLNLTGPDLLSAVCGYLRYFETNTATGLSVPGCDSPLLANLTGVLDLLSLASCMLGKTTSGLDAEVSEACQNYRSQADAAIEKKQESELAAVQARDYENLDRELRNITEDLLSVLDYAQRPAVPWFHSPIRLLKTNRNAVGFTDEAIRDATNAKFSRTQPNVTAQQVHDLLEALIPTLPSTIVTVDRPPEKDYLDIVQGQGVLSRSTDKITGLDWQRIGVKIADPVPDREQVKELLRAAQRHVADDNGIRRIQKAIDAVDGAGAAAVNATNDALDRALSEISGQPWAGVTDLKGLTSDQSLDLLRVSFNACRQGAAAASGLPGTFFACRELVGSDGGASADGRIDPVALANALLQTLPDSVTEEEIPDVLRTTVPLAVFADAHDLRRATEGVAISAGTPAVGNTVPAVGLLRYDLPLFQNEYVQYRLNAEIFAQNTGALVITTADPRVAASVVETLPSIDLSGLKVPADPSQPSLSPPEGNTTMNEYAMASTRAVLRALAAQLPQGGELLRILPVGLPLGIEQDPGPSRVPQAVASNPTGFSERGLLTARPDSYFNLSRTYEFNTRDYNASYLTVLVLYFPTFAHADKTLNQTLVLRNVTLQTAGYVGLFERDRSPANRVYERNFPIRYRENVEDWKLLYAVPDQALATSTAAGLQLKVWMGDQEWENNNANADLGLTSADLLAPGGPYSFAADCADTVAPGYPTGGFSRQARGIPGGVFLYWAGASDCETDQVAALRPHHVVDEGSVPYWTTTKPTKKPTDAFQYVVNVGPEEEMTEASMMWRRSVCNLLCNPLNLVSVALASGPATPTAATGLAQATSAIAPILLDVAGGAAGVLNAFNPVLDMTNATVFLEQSFLPGAQRTAAVAPQPSLPLHNYLVLDEKTAWKLMNASGQRDPEARIYFRDVSITGLGKWTPAESTIHVQKMDSHREDAYHGVVVAHSVDAGLTTIDTGSNVRAAIGATARGFVGIGTSGVGFAIEVKATEQATAKDRDSKHALEGQTWASAATLTITAYALGYPANDPAACTSVPLYSGYVDAYFRCVGVTQTRVIAAAYAGGNPTACYSAALQFMEQAQRRATGLLVTHQADAIYLAQPLNPLIVSAFRGDAPEPSEAAAVATLNRIREEGDVIVEYAGDNAALALELAKCAFETAGVSGIVLPAGTTGAFGEYVFAALNDTAAGRAVHAGDNLLQAFFATNPQYASHGPGVPLVSAKLLPPVGFSLLGFTDRNALNVVYEGRTLPTGLEEALLTYRELQNGAWVDARAPVTFSAGSPGPVVAQLPTPLATPIFAAASAWTGKRAVYAGGATNAGVSALIQTYDPATATAAAGPGVLPFGLRGAASAWIGDRLLLIGGTRADGTPTNQTLRYDPATGRVEPSSVPFPVPLEDASAVWDGRYVYVLGGRAGAAYSSAIYRFDPATNLTQVLPAVLSSPRARMAVAWDGLNVYLAGGANGQTRLDEIVRFTPRAGTATLLEARLPTPREGATAVWTGKRVAVFGGAGAPATSSVVLLSADGRSVESVTAPGLAGLEGAALAWDGQVAYVAGGRVGTSVSDRIYAFTDSVILGTTSLVLEHAKSYNLTLRLEDSVGQVATTSLFFQADFVAPAIAPVLADHSIETRLDSLDFTWTVQDPVSGLKSVRVETRTGSAGVWVSAGELLPASDVGTTTPRTVLFTFDTSVSQVYGVRLRAEDRLGHVALDEYTIIADHVLPNLLGDILDEVNDIISRPYLNATFQAGDGGSGLARVKVWLNDTVHGTSVELLDQSYAGTTNVQATLPPQTPTLLGDYRLRVWAADRAGNSASVEVDSVRIQAPPKLDLLSPEFLWQSVNNGTIRIKTDVTVPNFPGTATEVARVWVNASSGTNVFTSTVPTLGAGDAWWNPANAADGTYQVTVMTKVGIHATRRSANVNVTHPVGAIYNLTQYRTYGTLNGTGTTDLYRFTPGCAGGTVTVRLRSLDGNSVNLSLASGDPATVGRGGTYTNWTGWTTTEAVTSFSPTSNNAAYSVLVQHAPTADAHYAITVSKSCGGGGAPKPPDLTDWYVE